MTKIKDEVPSRTDINPVALRAAIRMWMHTKLVELHTIAGVREDLYLKLISMAAQLSYEETYNRYRAGDVGLIEARRMTKRIIFRKLTVDPPSILRIHDQVLVHVNSDVESSDAQKLEDLQR